MENIMSVDLVLGIGIVIFTIILFVIFRSSGRHNKSISTEASETIKATVTTEDSEVVSEDTVSNQREFVVIDTETTGIEDGYEVIEISIVDDNGEILLNSLVSPTINIESTAQEIHEIDSNDLLEAPTFRDLSEEIFTILRENIVVGYNTNYDLEAIANSARANGLDYSEELECICVMQYANQIFKRERSLKLTDLANALGIECSGAHRALNDAQLTRLVFQRLRELDDKGGELCPGFNNLDPKNLFAYPDEKSLNEWTSSDDRTMLFVSGTSGGMGRIAQLSEVTIKELHKLYAEEGRVDFTLRVVDGVPLIEMTHLNKQQLQEQSTENRLNYVQELKTGLLAAKAPARVSLKGVLKNYVDESLKPNMFNKGDFLFIKEGSLDTFLDDELLIPLADSSGAILAKQAYNRFWIRIVGNVINGYSARIEVIEKTTNYSTNVIVHLEQ
jgi:DNA polymerase III epsilon subunit-like protein